MLYKLFVSNWKSWCLAFEIKKTCRSIISPNNPVENIARELKKWEKYFFHSRCNKNSTKIYPGCILLQLLSGCWCFERIFLPTWKYATCTPPIMHLICTSHLPPPPQKKLHKRCFQFLLGRLSVTGKHFLEKHNLKRMNLTQTLKSSRNAEGSLSVWSSKCLSSQIKDLH